MLNKFNRRLIRAVDLTFSWIYGHRHPGTVGRHLISALGIVTRRCQPNDKWNLHLMAPFWVKAVNCPPVEPLPPSKSIFLLSGYRGALTHHIVLATLLAWRGHHVTIGYLPKLGSPIKPPLQDHPSAKVYLYKALSQIETASRGRIKCIDLLDDKTPVTIDETSVSRQALYDTVMAYQKEDLDFQDPEVAFIHHHMLKIGRTAQIAARNHFKKHRYDIALIGNGSTFENAQFCNVLTELGIPFNTFEKFAFRGIRVINHGNHALNGDDIDLIWSHRDELGYTKEYYLSKFCGQSLKAIQERSQNSTEYWIWELQREVNQSQQEALQKAGIPTDKTFILICPNVVFDAGYGKITNIFPSMKDWLIGTVKILLENTKHSVVVRAHPGEGLWWGGKEPVDEVLSKAGLKSGGKLIVIPGQAKVNTYRLMELCHLGIVFSSSVGLEMAVFGKHVLTGSNVIYSHKGFTHDADNQAEYYRKLKDLSQGDYLEPLEESKRRLATLFYFVYHYVAQYPYPYDKPSGIARRPPADLLSSANVKKFLPFLDLLVTNKEEFLNNLMKYLNAEEVLQKLNA